MSLKGGGFISISAGLWCGWRWATASGYGLVPIDPDPGFVPLVAARRPLICCARRLEYLRLEWKSGMFR